MIINTEKIEQAIFKLCTIANEVYPQELYDIVYEKYINERDFQKKTTLKNILLNANLSYKTRRPLCQDTGQVIVFAQIGQSVQLVGKNIEDSINDAVKRAYTENVYRKSTVKNAIFDRENSNNNTPAIIYTKIVGGNEITLQVLIKGAGSENCSITKMFLPSARHFQVYQR